MRTLQTLRASCVDAEPLLTEAQPTINLPVAGAMVKVPMQKLIPVDGFYLFQVDLYYTIGSGNPFVNGEDYVKIDIYSGDSTYNRIISSYFPHNNAGSMNLYTFNATSVIYCFAGSVYGIAARASKPGTIEVSDMRTYRIF